MSLPLFWFLVGLGFLAVELMLPALVLLFFGIGAWVTALLALMAISLPWQLMSFALVSLLALALLRRQLKAIFRGRSHTAGADDNQAPEHPLCHRTGVLSKDLTAGVVGEVEIDGSFWRAVAEESMPAGTTVKVLGTDPHDDLTLRVQRTQL